MSVRRPASAPAPTSEPGQNRLKAVLAAGLTHHKPVDTAGLQDKANPSSRSPAWPFGRPGREVRETKERELKEQISKLKKDNTECENQSSRLRQRAQEATAKLQELQQELGQRKEDLSKGMDAQRKMWAKIQEYKKDGELKSAELEELKGLYQQSAAFLGEAQRQAT